MRAASAWIAATAAGDGPSGFSFAESRTTGSPSSALSRSSGGGGTYGTIWSRTARQRGGMADGVYHPAPGRRPRPVAGRPAAGRSARAVWGRRGREWCAAGRRDGGRGDPRHPTPRSASPTGPARSAGREGGSARRSWSRPSARVVNGGASLTPPTPHASVNPAMAETLAARLRRAEAALRRGCPDAEWSERRRRLRLGLLREHVTAEYARLLPRHADGASGAESVLTHAAFMDDLLGWVYRMADLEARAAGFAPAPLVLVALGGYGRGELHPSSDLDLMLIHGGEVTAYVQRMAQEVFYTLWDLGLRVGHACRSLGDCLALARTDLPSRTSMQAARGVAGDRRLFRALQQTLRREVYRRDYPEFLAQMLAERGERYRKHGGSVYLQEPNVKESAGGLRDVHTALWLA